MHFDKHSQQTNQHCINTQGAKLRVHPVALFAMSILARVHRLPWWPLPRGHDVRSMGIEQRGSISDQREWRFNQWESGAPRRAKKNTRGAKSEHDSGFHACRLQNTVGTSRKRVWPATAVNQSASNIETSIPHWPPSWDILRRSGVIEIEREGLGSSGKEGERRTQNTERSGWTRWALIEYGRGLELLNVDLWYWTGASYKILNWVQASLSISEKSGWTAHVEM